jgi:hypothetical protein
LSPFHVLPPLLSAPAADAGGYALTYVLSLVAAAAAVISMAYAAQVSRRGGRFREAAKIPPEIH